MAFAASENDPMKKFGLPRSMLLEVCSTPTSVTPPLTTLVQFRLLSRPCSVVREVTEETLGKLDAASSGPSSAMRAVLSRFCVVEARV
jgi:small subunit ribosomal protein S29